MKKNKTINMRINDAITFCQLIDEYQMFNQAFIEFLEKEKYPLEPMAKLSKMSRNVRCHVSKKVRAFYNKYKFIIDTIEQNVGIQSFWFYNYAYENNSNVVTFRSCGFYQYLLLNFDKTDKILAILERLKELGFDKFELNPELDFSKEVYKLIVTYFETSDVAYLDNLESIPEYEYGVVKYKTNSSPYKIELRIFNHANTIVRERICLNSLTFDVDKLPKKLSGKDICNEIIGLTVTRQQEYTAIRNSVNLSVGVHDLECLLNEFSKTITKMESVDSKDEALQELRNMQQSLSQIQTLSSAYNQSITEGSSYITPELLQDEVKKYVIRRKDANIDLC